MTQSAPQSLDDGEVQDLAVVIPVWNLPEDLANLLGQIAELGIFSEVIICDDASEVDCSPEALGFTSEKLGANLVYLRSDEQRGAGHARNMGLAKVTAKNVLFFDSDDHLTDGIRSIWEQHLEGGIPDFTIYRHADTRVEENEGRVGSFKGDEKKWDIALGGEAPAFISRHERAHLCTISAYPWNKIYRTAFLRENGITCSETPVHNDIRIHWLSFVHAQTVLATRTIGAVHVVGGRDHHLTTRRGEERLCLGEIIEDITLSIRKTPNSMIFTRHFIHFVDVICQWNLDAIDPDVVPRFKKLVLEAYARFTVEEFRVYAGWQPARAAAIVKFLLDEGA